MTNKKISVFAPAKINLYLHLTGRLANGYHNLDSLVCFADIGDQVDIVEHDSFAFQVKGTFSNSFKEREKESFIDGDNLVVRAARSLAQITDKPLNVKITLTKNLPIASGIGGGSADAAATIWGLQELWDLPRNTDYLMPMLTKLGADVPVCLHSQTSVMRGIGDKLSPIDTLPEIPVVLVNPMVTCSTQDIFIRHSGTYKKNKEFPKRHLSIHECIDVLQAYDNDLFNPAILCEPKIDDAMRALNLTQSCLLSRMSGSGATCFGLYETIENAEQAAAFIRSENPDWWVKAGWLNRAERY